MAIFRDTREQLKDRLRKDLGLPQGEVTDQVLEAALSMAARYPADVPGIVERYSDLFCPWDGRLHQSTDCEQQVKEHQEAARAGRI